MKAAKQTMRRASYLLTEFSPNMMKDIGQDPMDYINLLLEAGVHAETDRQKWFIGARFCNNHRGEPAGEPYWNEILSILIDFENSRFFFRVFSYICSPEQGN